MSVLIFALSRKYFDDGNLKRKVACNIILGKCIEKVALGFYYKSIFSFLH